MRQETSRHRIYVHKINIGKISNNDIVVVQIIYTVQIEFIGLREPFSQFRLCDIVCRVDLVELYQFLSLHYRVCWVRRSAVTTGSLSRTLLVTCKQETVILQISD